MADHNLVLSEEDRQMLLMALAHLAVERPGWDHALGEIAARIDNPGPELYLAFKDMHESAAREREATEKIRKQAERHEQL